LQQFCFRENPPFSALMAITRGNTMENSGKQNPKMGFKPPRAGFQIYKLLIWNNLRCKALGQIQNLVPHRLTSRLKFNAVERNCRLVVTGDTKQHHSVRWAMLSGS
jgi:hypothetical protein